MEALTHARPNVRRAKLRISPCLIAERPARKPHKGAYLVLPVRIELTTSPLPRGCSTTELRQRRAGWENRPMKGRERAILATRPDMAQARGPPKNRSQRKASVACRGVIILQPWTIGDSARRR